MGRDPLMVIGLMGKSCSGKNMASLFLQEKGARTVDLDLINHDVIRKNTKDLISLFGDDILGHDFHVDRKKLGHLVFTSVEKRKVLEQFLYPLIEDKVREIIRKNNNHPVVLNGAVLHRSGIITDCTHIIFISSCLPLRFLRAVIRDGFYPMRIMRRFANQKDVKTQLLPSFVDTYNVRNNLTRVSLQKRIHALYAKLLEEK